MDDNELWAPAPARTTRPEIDLGLPGYTDVREVARGGDSVVYRARQPALHRDVAIKVLLETDPVTVARFARELEITVRLGRQHPHVVTVLDTATTGQGHPCLVMDFHDLGSLHDRLRSHGPLPVAEVVAAGTAVADALAFAHGHGVLHRDVKPQNVLVLPTSYVLTDFGIARMADAGHTASLERFSYRHASPQVLDGLEPTVTDDVWSLGSTLFTLLDGRAPFAAPDPADDTALGYLRRVRTGERRHLERIDVPDGLRALVDRCLAPAREHRYATAADVHAALLALPTETRSWSPGAAAEASASTPARGYPRVARPAAPTVRPVPPAVAPPAAAPWSAAPDAHASAPAAAADEHAADALPPAARPDDDLALAPSALTLLGAAPTTAAGDDEATGTHPEAAVGPRPVRPATPARRARPGWVPVVAFMGGAILLGSAVGVGVTMWAAEQRSEARLAATPTPTPVTQEVPQHEDPLPTPTAPAQVEQSDPAIAPTALVAADRGTSIALTWDDPTEGGVTFVVVDLAGNDGRGEAVGRSDVGTEEVTVEGVDPDAPRICLVLVAIDVTNTARQGVSGEACVDR